MDAGLTIIGAGVVGLAMAEKLSRDHENVFVLEKHFTFGQETSSRNSEVIHAGIYYPANSLKASLCFRGKRMLYDFCDKYEVPYNNCGKIIIATTQEEIQELEGIQANAARNGVDDLISLDRQGILNYEPNVFGLKGIFSPGTGIIDSHRLMKQLETNAINNGCQIVYGSAVTGLKKISQGYEITLSDSDKQEFKFTSSKVINSAGLESDNVAAMVGISDEKIKIHFCKGEYFRMKPPKNKLVKRLVYPVPHKNMEGIGVHVTIDMDGGVKLGPDVTYLKENVCDYSVTKSKQEAFYLSAKKFLPFLEFDDIVPEMAGIRPKIQKSGEPARDFYIAEESARGFPGFINLIGMESPGLTASLAIAEYVSKLI
jgi:L-2-hydroxyglutarate oxidase LhgO